MDHPVAIFAYWDQIGQIIVMAISVIVMDFDVTTIFFMKNAVVFKQGPQ
jgi:predicted peroxiredoxin